MKILLKPCSINQIVGWLIIASINIFFHLSFVYTQDKELQNQSPPQLTQKYILNLEDISNNYCASAILLNDSSILTSSHFVRSICSNIECSKINIYGSSITKSSNFSSQTPVSTKQLKVSNTSFYILKEFRDIDIAIITIQDSENKL